MKLLALTYYVRGRGAILTQRDPASASTESHIRRSTECVITLAWLLPIGSVFVRSYGCSSAQWALIGSQCVPNPWLVHQWRIFKGPKCLVTWEFVIEIMFDEEIGVLNTPHSSQLTAGSLNNPRGIPRRLTNLINSSLHDLTFQTHIHMPNRQTWHQQCAKYLSQFMGQKQHYVVYNNV